jgi:RNA polymerase sigma-70 factor (ECF subfamily)
MDQESPSRPLNLISTLWSVVCQAHQGSAEAAAAARGQLLERYGGAVRRYLRGVLHDPDAAEDLFQEFALRLARGDLRGADQRRGRFRDFLKGMLFHLVAHYRRQQRKWPGPLPAAHLEPVASDTPGLDPDGQFIDSWRDELLARSWAALAAAEGQGGSPSYGVLRFRAHHPELNSQQMAEQLTAQLGRPLTATAVRQILHRAREKFADLLLEEVAHSLQAPTAEELEQELIDLGLLDYCRPALERRGHTG